MYEFKEGKPLIVTSEMKKNFWENGYIIIRNLLTNDEVKKLHKSLEAPDSALMAQSYQQDDGDGMDVGMVLWNHPGNDLTGMINRCEKVVNTCQKLMDGEVYHYHTKIVMKNPRTGGQFQWHQDYGYWYRNGMLFPDVVSVTIAIDDMDLGNGCLQVLRGSHKLGRVDHVRSGDQAGADMERVNEAAKVLKKDAVVMKAGDALFFHCNLLHRSDQNKSDRRRWAMTACYNKADNDPVVDHHHARYIPLKVVPNSAIMACENFNDVSGKWFTNPNKSNPDYLPPKRRKVEE